MLIFVVIINLVISSLNFYLVWRLTKCRQKLKILTKDLNILTANIEIILPLTGEIFHLGTIKTRNFRANYDKIDHQIQTVRKILILVRLINKFRRKQFAIIRRQNV